MANKQRVNIGYTGGLDSSYAMIALSTYDIEIQPYYLKDNRASEEKELSSITQITEDIKSNQKTQCDILPLITLSTADVTKDQDVTEAYNRLKKTTGIGSQYDWLARFAKSVEGLCLAIEKSSHSKARRCITTYGNLKPQNEGDFKYYVIDPDKSSPDLVTVFGWFRLPHMTWEKTKSEYAEGFKKLGFEKSLGMTWFCFTPVGGEPCGTCNPCISAIEDGMEWRFSKDALRRYRMRKVVRPLNTVRRKIIKSRYFSP